MNARQDMNSERLWTALRIAAWSAAMVILVLPLVAMQFTDEVHWTMSDFVVAAVLLGGSGLVFEFGLRRSDDNRYRLAVCLAVGTSLFLVWANLAVGLIGSEKNPANLMYIAVIGIGIVGGIIARFRPQGMARTLLAMATTQGIIALVAIVAGLGRPWSGPLELVMINALFVALFAGSAWLFWRAGSSMHQTY